MLWQRSDNFRSLLNAVILSKCFRAKMWENSKHVTRQLSGIGVLRVNRKHSHNISQLLCLPLQETPSPTRSSTLEW